MQITTNSAFQAIPKTCTESARHANNDKFCPTALDMSLNRTVAGGIIEQLQLQLQGLRFLAAGVISV